MSVYETRIVTRRLIKEEAHRGEVMYLPEDGVTVYEVAILDGKPVQATLKVLTYGLQRAYQEAEERDRAAMDGEAVAVYHGGEDARYVELWRRYRAELIEMGVSEREVDLHRPIRPVLVRESESLGPLYERLKLILDFGGEPPALPDCFPNVLRRIEADFSRARQQDAPPATPLSPSQSEALRQAMSAMSFMSGLRNGEVAETP